LGQHVYRERFLQWNLVLQVTAKKIPRKKGRLHVPARLRIKANKIRQFEILGNFPLSEKHGISRDDSFYWASQKRHVFVLVAVRQMLVHPVTSMGNEYTNVISFIQPDTQLIKPGLVIDWRHGKEYSMGAILTPQDISKRTSGCFRYMIKY